MRSYSELVEILREREFELFTIRRNFDELSTKFSQLEKAFTINLGVHRTLQSELAIYKLGKSSNKPILQEEPKRNVASDNMDEAPEARTELYSSLTKVRVEKERCEEALRYQQKVAERRKLDCQKTIATIREECESILQHCRESGEKQFHELLRIYENTVEKVRICEKNLEASRAQESLTRERILQVASIFESLQRIKDVRIHKLCEDGTAGEVCHCIASSYSFEFWFKAAIHETTHDKVYTSVVLRSLANESGNLFEESIKKLRRFAWDIEENCENQSVEFLQRQNSVLCQVVKNLKKKLQTNFGESPRSKECTEAIKTESNADRQSLIPRVVKEKEYEKSMNNETENAIVKPSPSFSKTEGTLVPGDGENDSEDKPTNEKMENDESFTNENPQMKKSIRVEAFEFHRNGIRYEEYTFLFFNGRELRVRHSNDVAIKSPTLVIEFVDTEQKFQEAPIERTVFYLGENVEEIVNFSKSVMHCGVQTKRTKFNEKFVQTTITGSSGFFRSNAGVTMLNSEKRAIERSVKYLESTVANLKGSILGQARSMIGSDAKHLGNDFFDCIHRLENSK